MEEVGLAVSLRNYILTILLLSFERLSTEAHFRDLFSFLKDKSMVKYDGFVPCSVGGAPMVPGDHITTDCTADID